MIAPTNKNLDSIILRYVGYALVFLSMVYLLHLARAVLPLFFLGALLAYALDPVLRRLQRRGHSRRSAIGFVSLTFILIFIIGLALLATAWQQAQSLAENLPSYEESVAVLVDNGRAHFEHLKLPVNLKKSIDEGVTQFQATVPGEVAGRLHDAGVWALGSFGSLCISVVVLPVITLWFMVETNTIRARMLMLVPPPYRRDVTEIALSINELLGRYVRGQMIICGLFGLFCTCSFELLHLFYGMNYPLVLGLLAGFMYIVPYVGMFTIAMAAGLTAYITGSHPVPCALCAVGSCVLFNLILDYGVAPRVLGRGTGLHPLMVIFALLSGAHIGGILGMIVAVPVLASMRVVAIYLFPQLAAPIPQDLLLDDSLELSAISGHQPPSHEPAPSEAGLGTA